MAANQPAQENFFSALGLQREGRLEQAAALVRQAGCGQVVVPAVWVGGGR